MVFNFFQWKKSLFRWFLFDFSFKKVRVSGREVGYDGKELCFVGREGFLVENIFVSVVIGLVFSKIFWN